MLSRRQFLLGSSITSAVLLAPKIQPPTYSEKSLEAWIPKDQKFIIIHSQILDNRKQLGLPKDLPKQISAIVKQDIKFITTEYEEVFETLRKMPNCFGVITNAAWVKDLFPFIPRSNNFQYSSEKVNWAFDDRLHKLSNYSLFFNVFSLPVTSMNHSSGEKTELIELYLRAENFEMITEANPKALDEMRELAHAHSQSAARFEQLFKKQVKMKDFKNTNKNDPQKDVNTAGNMDKIVKDWFEVLAAEKAKVTNTERGELTDIKEPKSDDKSTIIIAGSSK